MLYIHRHTNNSPHEVHHTYQEAATMKLSSLFASLAVAASLISGTASATPQDLTTWSTYGSVAVSPSSATMYGSSGIYNNFNLAPGAAFSFNWFFQANDYMPFNDWAAVFVDGNLNLTLASVGSVGNYGNSGWQNFSTILTNAVNGNITFSVNNGLDSALNSSLTVANVNVPEPDMLLLMATALALVGFASRRKSKTAV